MAVINKAGILQIKIWCFFKFNITKDVSYGKFVDDILEQVVIYYI